MEILLQQLINGLVLGSVYALVALGYTMVYGILGLINFAHGDVLMVGAMIALTVAVPLTAAGWPVWLVIALAVAAAMLVCMLLNVIIERIAYRPLRSAPRLAPLITAIGVSILLQIIARLIWSPNHLVFPDLLPKTPIAFAGATITVAQIILLGVSLSVMAGLLILVNRTRLGRAMRATAENPQIAGLMGVNINQVIAATFALGAALAALAGFLVAGNYNKVDYMMGFEWGLWAFCAAVLGGIGNLAGAVLGGLLLGVIESFAAGYIGQLTDLCHLTAWFNILADECSDGGSFPLMGSNYQKIFAFVMLILVLTLRPSGLLGERVADRA